MKFRGIYLGLGTGAIRLGLGFRPNHVRIRQIGTANMVELDWTRDMARSATGAGGLVRAGVANTPGYVLLSAAAGVRHYFGKDAIATASLAYQLPISMVPAYAGARQGTITEWTLGNATNRTGNFDAALDTDKCGVGSMIEVRTGAMATPSISVAAIVALSNHGAAANEVTLDRAVPSGRVTFIGCAWDVVPAPVGVNMPEGIEILDTTYANVAATVCAIEAED